MKNAVIGVLATLVVLMGGYLVYDKVIDKEEVNKSSEIKSKDGVNNNKINEEENSSIEDTPKSNLDNTIFDEITQTTFKSLTIKELCENGYCDEKAIITDYSIAYEILSKLSQQNYEKTTTTGVGLDDYDVRVSYIVNGVEKEFAIQPSMILDLNDRSYVYKINASDSEKSELKSYIHNMYVRYK